MAVHLCRTNRFLSEGEDKQTFNCPLLPVKQSDRVQKVQEAGHKQVSRLVTDPEQVYGQMLEVRAGNQSSSGAKRGPLPELEALTHIYCFSPDQQQNNQRNMELILFSQPYVQVAHKEDPTCHFSSWNISWNKVLI